jgi:hypothetical protein
MTTDTIATPWYRQGWPWFLISLPGLAVVGGIITAAIAIRTNDGTVTADYYKQGLAINAEVARADVARELGLRASVQLAGLADGDAVRVELSGTRALPPEPALRLRLTHPGRAGADRVAVLARSSVDAEQREAVYVGTLQADADGALKGPVAWQVILESPGWRIDDSFTTGEGGRFNLQAR